MKQNLTKCFPLFYLSPFTFRLVNSQTRMESDSVSYRETERACLFSVPSKRHANFFHADSRGCENLQGLPYIRSVDEVGCGGLSDPPLRHLSRHLVVLVVVARAGRRNLNIFPFQNLIPLVLLYNLIFSLSKFCDSLNF